MANWESCPAVEKGTGEQGGLWVFASSEVPLYKLFEHLVSGGTVNDFADRFGVDVGRVRVALEFEADELHDFRLDYPDAVPFTRASDRQRGASKDGLWSNCPAVEQATGRLGGAWVFKNSRLALYVLYGHLAVGSTLDEFDEWYGMDPANPVVVLEHEARELRQMRLAHADII